MFIEKGKELVCLRYADFKGIDTIEEHNELIEKQGYAWFGKAGSKPKVDRLDIMLENKPAFIILKSKVGYFICEFEEYSLDRPNDGDYPEYYKDHVLSDMHISMWFKILKIKKVLDTMKMEKIVVSSSKRTVPDVIRHSMSSSFYTKAIENIEV